MAAAAIVKNHKNLVPAHFYPCFRRPFIPFAPFTLLFHFRFLLSLLFALFPFLASHIFPFIPDSHFPFILFLHAYFPFSFHSLLGWMSMACCRCCRASAQLMSYGYDQLFLLPFYDVLFMVVCSWNIVGKFSVLSHGNYHFLFASLRIVNLGLILH